MSDFAICLLGMFAVIAPFGALASLQGTEQPPRLVAWSPVVALAVLWAAALINDPLLDWLKISPESFQFAAGAAMAPLAARLIIAGDSMPAPRSLSNYAWLVPFAVPLLAGPSSIIAAISYAARFGIGETVLASTFVATLASALFAASSRFKMPLVVTQTLARLSGGLLIVIAVELAVDGVHSV